MTDVLKLGIIGLSEGNGHPYSWSAICNGYNANYLYSCPFPVISEYLSRHKFPEDGIKDVQVTHVWTQEQSLAKDIARFSNIPYVVNNYIDMIGSVDGILLARDDPESHYEMSKPFLEVGLPVYIDKPVASDLDTLNKIYLHEQYPGQIFSCSALRYAREFSLSNAEHESLGRIKHVSALSPKSWIKYGVHIIDPVLNMFGLYEDSFEILSNLYNKGTRIVIIRWNDMTVSFTTLGVASGPITINIFGEKGYTSLVFNDAFYAFKASIERFVYGIRAREQITKKKELETVVSILELVEKG